MSPPGGRLGHFINIGVFVIAGINIDVLCLFTAIQRVQRVAEMSQIFAYTFK